MRYLLLIYGDEKARLEASGGDAGAMREAWSAFTRELGSSGRMLGGEALKPTSTATTVRLKESAPIIMDGPFAETKEQLAGFYMIDAPDLDDAIAWAAKMPNVHRGGSVEIRPIQDFEQPG